MDSAAVSDSGNSSAATSKASTGKSSGGKSTKQELETLIAQIHQSASIQAERIQAIVDGAVLAVEQVQDKRIELLEKGPEVTVSDIVFDIFISACFIGVGKALVPITQSIARELVQTASYYGQVQSAGKVAGLSKALRYAALAAKADFEEEYKVGFIKPEDVQKYNKYVRGILVEAAEEGVSKIVERGLEEVEKGGRKVKRINLEFTDTPGVAILSAAQSYASNQRAAIAIQHAGFEAIVRSDPDNKTLELIRKAVTWPALNEEIISIRDKHKMLFEAIIWAQLFGFDQDPNIQGVSFTQDILLPGVTRPLMSYWRRRFARTIEQWLSALLRQYPTGPFAVESNQGVNPKPIASPQAGKYKVNSGAFESADFLWQQSTVIRFFVAISRDLNELYKNKIGESAVEVTTKPVAKKK